MVKWTIMSQEIESNPFVSPARLFTEMQAPPNLTAFRSAMKFQYEFDDGTLDKVIPELMKAEYWRKVSPDVLAMVRTPHHQRMGQLGSVLGYKSREGVVITFGDTVVETIDENDLLLILKANISPVAQIEIRYLDEDWEQIIEHGQLIGYRRNANPPPRGYYIVQIGNTVREQEDWGILSGSKIRFSVVNQEILIQ